MNKSKTARFTALLTVFCMLPMLTTAQVPNEPGSGNALIFNGSDNYVNCGNTASLNVSGDITVEAWVKIPTVAEAKVIVSKYSFDGASFDRGWHLIHAASGIIQFNGRDGSGVYRSSGGTISIDDNKWHHVTGQRQGDIWRIFVDGILSSENNVGSNGSIANSFNVFIGKYMNSSFAIGQIDEVRIWNRALTQSEIRDNMCKKLTGNESGLVGYWRFDEGSGTTALDSSPNGNDGTLQ